MAISSELWLTKTVSCVGHGGPPGGALANEFAPGGVPPRCPPARTPERSPPHTRNLRRQVLWPYGPAGAFQRQAEHHAPYVRSASGSLPKTGERGEVRPASVSYAR